MKEEILMVGEEVHEIPVAPITLIYKDPALAKRLSYDNRIELTPEVCKLQGGWVADAPAKWHKETPDLLALVFKIDPLEVTRKWVAEAPEVVTQVLGLIDASLKITDQGGQIVWIHPESGLHPAHQAQLGEVVLRLIKRVGGKPYPGSKL